MALNADGTVEAWGAPWATTVPPAAVEGVARIIAGGENSIAILSNGTVVAWGGGDARGPLNDGGRYDPVANRWTALPRGAPSPRYVHTTVWTGSEVIVWGGNDGSGRYLDDGGRYDPTADAWTKFR